MNACEPLPLNRSWPLWEQGRNFDLGHVLNCAVTDAIEPQAVGGIGLHHAGLWECDLSNDELIWSGGVYDIFGLERRSAITRAEAISFYHDDSRAKLERLRSHAIRHTCGFTLDVQIYAAAVRECRMLRVIAAPVFGTDGVVKLHGLKLLI